MYALSIHFIFELQVLKLHISRKKYKLAVFLKAIDFFGVQTNIEVYRLWKRFYTFLS